MANVVRRLPALWAAATSRRAYTSAFGAGNSSSSRLCSSQAVKRQEDNSPKDRDGEASKEAAAVEQPKEFTNVAGLKEFFDDPKFFGQDEVKHGRSWAIDELRIKSNSDLHRLWFVFLKEWNMLLTMQEAGRRELELMPSEERIDKVEESMANLESVVRERNRAYFDLEVGETGERPSASKLNWMGLVNRFRLSQHWMPQRYNASYNRKYPMPFNDKAQKWFLNHYREVRMDQKAKERRLERRAVRQQLRAFPDVDLDLVKRRYPNIDVDEITLKLSDKLTLKGTQPSLKVKGTP